MAVLVEGISVVIRIDSINTKFTGSWSSFLNIIPNSTMCHDTELVRVGFLDPQNVQSFAKTLEAGGLIYLQDDKAVDFTVVDQLKGLLAPCDWLEFARFKANEEDGKMSAVWLFEGSRIAAGIHMSSTHMEIATPLGWKFEGSLSDKFRYFPEAERIPHSEREH